MESLGQFHRRTSVVLWSCDKSLRLLLPPQVGMMVPHQTKISKITRKSSVEEALGDNNDSCFMATKMLSMTQ